MEHDDDLDDEEASDLNEEVRSRARDPGLEETDFNPRSRLSDVRHRASKYEREYRLRLLHRLLMRGIPLDQIAQELDVSVATVQRDRSILFDRLRAAARKLDIHLVVADSMAFYQEVQAVALRTASSTKTPLTQRLQALRTALASKNDMHRMFATAGVYDALKFRKENAQSQNDMGRLMDMTERLLSEDDAAVTEPFTGLKESDIFDIDDEENQELFVV